MPGSLIHVLRRSDLDRKPADQVWRRSLSEVGLSLPTKLRNSMSLKGRSLPSGGEVLGLLGADGAGKATTLRMGYGFPEPGKARSALTGHSPRAAPPHNAPPRAPRRRIARACCLHAAPGGIHCHACRPGSEPVSMSPATGPGQGPRRGDWRGRAPIRRGAADSMHLGAHFGAGPASLPARR